MESYDERDRFDQVSQSPLSRWLRLLPSLRDVGAATRTLVGSRFGGRALRCLFDESGDDLRMLTRGARKQSFAAKGIDDDQGMDGGANDKADQVIRCRRRSR